MLRSHLFINVFAVFNLTVNLQKNYIFKIVAKHCYLLPVHSWPFHNDCKTVFLLWITDVLTVSKTVFMKTCKAFFFVFHNIKRVTWLDWTNVYDQLVEMFLFYHQGTVLECLSDHLDTLNETCRHEMLRVAELQVTTFFSVLPWHHRLLNMWFLSKRYNSNWMTGH